MQQKFTLDSIELLILFGAFSGFVFSFWLFLDSKRVENRLLSSMLFMLTYDSAIFIVLKHELYNQMPGLHWLPYGLYFTFGPALWLYTLALTGSLSVNSGHYLLHFLWIGADYLHSIYHLIYGRTIQHPVLHTILDQTPFLALLPFTFYLYKSHQALNQFHSRLPEVLSDFHKIKVHWLDLLIKFTFATMLVALLYGVFNLIFNLSFENEYSLRLIFTLYILWLGLNGIAQSPIVITWPKVNPPLVTKEKTDEIARALIRSMEIDRLYLNPTLSLKDIEAQLNFKFSSDELSFTLNSTIGKNFYTFVNEYRLKEFAILIQSGNSSLLNLTGLAKNSGFNSKATFYRACKTITGCTPSVYAASIVSQLNENAVSLRGIET